MISSDHVGVTTMEELDQNFLHPLHPENKHVAPDWDRTWAPDHGRVSIKELASQMGTVFQNYGNDLIHVLGCIICTNIIHFKQNIAYLSNSTELRERKFFNFVNSVLLIIKFFFLSR